MMLSVAVVTSSSGRHWLHDAIRSVKAQTYKGPITHYVFVNGEGFHERASKILSHYVPDIEIAYLPAIGGNVAGTPGPEATYGAAPFLVDADVICYLNDDDIYEPDHVADLIELIQREDLGWAYSLRKAVELDGSPVADDNCESLGHWPCVYNPNAFLVDVSSYAVRRPVAVMASAGWYNTPIGDRTFLMMLKQVANAYGCTGNHSVRYRLQPHGGVDAEFFRKGNAAMAKRFPEGFPWAKTTVFRKEAK